jgi:hypothetical protein
VDEAKERWETALQEDSRLVRVPYPGVLFTPMQGDA